MITVVVEGDTDSPFVEKLCAEVGVAVYPPIVDAGGKDGIDQKLDRWANAAKGSPYLIVRDLDRDAPCAAEWLSKNATQVVGQWFCLRLAVRAIEAWFLADPDVAASCLRVHVSNVPVAPDDEPDPKDTIVRLARRSMKKGIREGVAPGPSDSRKIGALYETWLIESARTWRVSEAMKRSPSLVRAHRALVDLKLRYESFLAGT